MNPSSSETPVRFEADEDCMRAEYDFSKGHRGRYVHLFGEVAADEDAVFRFWRACGLDAQRFDGSERLDSRLPDFRLINNGLLWALCEVKSVVAGEVIADEADLTAEVRAFREHRTISNAFYGAARLLIEANPEHRLLNVVAVVEGDIGVKAGILSAILRGEWNPLRGDASPIPLALRKQIESIDLCLCLEPSRYGNLSVKSVFFGNDENRVAAAGLLGATADQTRNIA